MAPVAKRAVHRDAHDCDDLRRNRRAGVKIKVNLLYDYQTQAGVIAAAATATKGILWPFMSLLLIIRSARPDLG